MFEIKEKKVNRKQFHYLVTKFLLEKKVLHRFYDSSLRYKLKCLSVGRHAYRSMYEKYNFSNKDTLSEHIYKCIDIYCKERGEFSLSYLNTYYHGSIKGFFSLCPVTFEEGWEYFWRKISDEWMCKTQNIMFDNGNN